MSNTPSDKPSRRSDVLSVLKNIESMFRMSQDVLCSHARNGLLFSVAMEAQMLSLKLDTMASRWRIHIPFKEACEVDLTKWAVRIESMSQYLHKIYSDADVMELDTYCPDKHFLLDLYSRLLQEKSQSGSEHVDAGNDYLYYRETDMEQFVSRQNLMHQALADWWLDYLNTFSDLTASHLSLNADKFAESVEKDNELSGCFSPELLSSQIEDLNDEENPRFLCCMALKELSGKLYALKESLERSFTPQHFSRLTDRILIEREYGGPEIRDRVRAEIAQWKNATPDDEIAEGRNEEMRKAYNNIVEMKFRRKFQDYVKSYIPDIEQKKSAIGKFLFHCRRDITIGELQEFMANLFRIIYFRRDQLEEEACQCSGEVSEPQKPASSSPDIYLSERLCASPRAKRMLVELLRAADPYICRKLRASQRTDSSAIRYAGWSWWHIKRAFFQLGFLMKDLSDKEFFQYLSLVLPGRTPTGISQGYYRFKHETSDGICEKVLEVFRPVAEMME